MTEKDYSGATTSKIGKNVKLDSNSSKQTPILNQAKQSKSKQVEIEATNESVLSEEDIASYRKAGVIAKQVKEYAKKIIKKDLLLSEIAELIETKIKELGGEVAFPVNLSINDVAAHYTPTLRDETKAHGLLKVDIGVHVQGKICDIAFTLDLSDDKKYTSLIEASERALEAALELVKANKDKTKIAEIGKVINKEISSSNYSPIVNLSGHGLDEFDIHSGLTIPNFDNSSNKEIGEGAFAIEPFATLSNGSGLVYDGAGSNIYHLGRMNQVRDSFSREVLEFIIENKKTLPFSQRELEKKFGSRALVALSNLRRVGIIEEFPQLIEKSHSAVSQAETSLIIYSGKVEILCDI